MFLPITIRKLIHTIHIYIRHFLASSYIPFGILPYSWALLFWLSSQGNNFYDFARSFS